MLDNFFQILNWILKAGLITMLIVGIGLLILLIVAEFKDHR